MRFKEFILSLLFISLLNISVTAQAEQAVSKQLTKEEKIEIVNAISKLLNDNYVFPDVAIKIEEYLKAKLDDGSFDQIKETKEFSEILTQEVQSISHDKHMRVVEPRRRPTPSNGIPNPIARNYQGRIQGESRNFGFAKLEKLEDNVGYMDLTGFPPLAVAKDFADLAMKYLSTSDALIIDLRRNGGGNPDLIQYICSYLFEKPTHINSIYYRLQNTTTDFITFEKVDGKKMSDVPLFVLTSDYTFSGGEEFAYNIQTQKRGILIGEVTGGGANPGGMFPITPSLGIFIPTGRAINPITKTNWEGVGVIPDIKVDADNALETALPKAREAAIAYRKSLDEIIYRHIDDILSTLDKAEKLFNENNTDEAEALVKSAMDNGIKNQILDEVSINQMGYEKLNAENYAFAIALFKYNTAAFPESSNAYDSLGEAYMKIDDKPNAVINYKKSLDLNPNNSNAVEQLKKLSN